MSRLHHKSSYSKYNSQRSHNASSSAGNKVAIVRKTVSDLGDEGSVDYLAVKSEDMFKKAGKVRVPKRNLSTSNLPANALYMSPTNGIPLDPDIAAQQQHLKRTLKRAHSSMSISECDELMNDTDAANDLFLQFVSKVTRDIDIDQNETKYAVISSEKPRQVLECDVDEDGDEEDSDEEEDEEREYADEGNGPEQLLTDAMSSTIKVESDDSVPSTHSGLSEIRTPVDMRSTVHTSSFRASTPSTSSTRSDNVQSPVGLDMEYDADDYLSWVPPVFNGVNENDCYYFTKDEVSPEGTIDHIDIGLATVIYAGNLELKRLPNWSRVKIVCC